MMMVEHSQKQMTTTTMTMTMVAKATMVVMEMLPMEEENIVERTLH
jgi:hypothetical protein